MADLEHLHPELRRRLDHALADHPGAYVLSGGRSHTRQAELAECYQRFLVTRRCPCAECNPANPAGTSWHEYDERAPWPGVGAGYAAATELVGGPWAMAVDLAGAYRGIRANARSYGLCFPIDGEDWHAQPWEVTEPQRAVGAWRRLPLAGTPEPPPPPPPDEWGTLFVPLLAQP